MLKRFTLVQAARCLKQTQSFFFSTTQPLTASTSNTNVKRIIELFSNRGDEAYFGDVVSKSQHGLQAAHFASENNESDEMIVACLLHDIGHLLDEDDMGGYGVRDHGLIGASFLRNELNLKSNKIGDLVGQHINAKRYLVYRDGQTYYNSLSKASQKTLEYQGGPMTHEEATQYEKDFNSHLVEEIVRLRKYDDLGKQKDVKMPGLNHYIPLLEKYF